MDMFLDESREHLQSINNYTLKLEKNPHELGLVNEIFRSAHTLKGMSATMGFDDIALLTHEMENILDLIRNEKLKVSTNIIDITFEAIEFLEVMVKHISEGGDGKRDISALVQRIKLIEIGAQSSGNEVVIDVVPLSEMKTNQYETKVESITEKKGFRTYQLTVQLREDCLLKAVRVFMIFEILELLGDIVKSVPEVSELNKENFEHSFSVQLQTNEEEGTIYSKVMNVSEVHSVILSVVNQEPQPNSKDNNSLETKEVVASSQTQNVSSKTIRVNIDRIDKLMNLFGEMVIDRGRLEDISSKSGDLELVEAVENLTRATHEMQSMMLSMRMVPIEQVFNRFPRMVRGLAKDLKKEISLEIVGSETEVDRTVIDEIGDPLVHLIRNSIDHGIESPAQRLKQGKSSEGTIKLKAYHSGSHVFIEIEDNGGGINRQKVVGKAIENGVLTSENSTNLTDIEVFNLIFASGFSTVDVVSDLSGRGVGLDVVRNKIEALGGEVFVQSEEGTGSLFTIKLPLTLSILTTLLVEVQNETYALPLISIEETLSLKKEQILHMEGQQLMDFRNKVIPLIRLQDAFRMKNDPGIKHNEHEAVVIIRSGDKIVGLVVDSLIGQKDIVLKSLGEYLGDVEFLSGATILGDGSVALIVDPNSLIR